MAAPATVLTISNTNVSPGPSIWAAGVEIVAQGHQDYTGGQVAAVCADLNFVALFIAGTASMQVNGIGIPNNTGAALALIVAVAIGDINGT